jgi:hypothetical protein
MPRNSSGSSSSDLRLLDELPVAGSADAVFPDDVVALALVGAGTRRAVRRNPEWQSDNAPNFLERSLIRREIARQQFCVELILNLVHDGFMTPNV